MKENKWDRETDSFLHGLMIPSVATWTFRAQEVTTAGSLSQIDKRNSEEGKASHLDLNGSYQVSTLSNRYSIELIRTDRPWGQLENAQCLLLP